MSRQHLCSTRSRIAFARNARFLCIVMMAVLSIAQEKKTDLTQLSLEQLSKIEVTSVSKKEQKLSDTAAAVYVITQQDIHNSAATSIPELLRMVPGLDVAQIDRDTWAISARGFAAEFADKMLVLIDGRSVFHPLFSGVIWNQQDLMLEDIDRIEVIRGPGATIWGTNAVNGVINIITKSAKDTPGALVTAGAGDIERSFGSARYGGKLGKSTDYRIYSKYFDEGPTVDILGQSIHDSQRAIRGGFRADSRISDRDALMLEGDSFGNRVGALDERFSFTEPFISFLADTETDSGTNLLARWRRKSLTGSETNIQASYSHIAEPLHTVHINGNVVSLSVQHARSVGDRQSIVAGLEFDYRSGRTSSSNLVFFQPANLSFEIASGFIQDEMLFAQGAVRFTAGLRIDHNSLNGIGFQPNVRLLWKINPRHSVWLAYSLANRSLSPTDTAVQVNFDAFLTPDGVQVLRVLGNPDIQPIRLHAFDIGYRVQPHKTVSFDLAAFYNLYSNLIGSEAGQPFFESGPPPRLVLPLLQAGIISGASFGGEFTAHWTPSERIRIGAAYSFIELSVAQSGGFTDGAPAINGGTPRHKLAIDTFVNLTRTLSLSTALSFVDRRVDPRVPGYTQVDSKLGWQPRPSIEFSIGTKNLFNKEHLEIFSELPGISGMLGRSVYGKATWRFRR
ncbi:MAG: TonB-dependent receptor [Acidobacteriia bacterium]|nr:TonB-dependent receptor [Terriglobia bacterium]